jgi:hypothetical protein
MSSTNPLSALASVSIVLELREVMKPRGAPVRATMTSMTTSSGPTLSSRSRMPPLSGMDESDAREVARVSSVVAGQEGERSDRGVSADEEVRER